MESHDVKNDIRHKKYSLISFRSTNHMFLKRMYEYILCQTWTFYLLRSKCIRIFLTIFKFESTDL